MKRKMTSKRALRKLSGVPIFEDDDRNIITDIDCCCVYKGDLCEIYEREVNIIKKDLEVLEAFKYFLNRKKEQKIITKELMYNATKIKEWLENEENK